MNYSGFLFTIFLAVGGVLVFAIWGNMYAYAQQSSTVSLPSTIISPEIKTKMCNPSNPNLKVVNTTEARICGISKTVKPPLASAATPKTTSSLLTQLPNSSGSGSNTGVTTNVPIVLKPLPGGTCPQGYHVVSGSVCIKDLPSAAQTKTTTPTASLPTATTNVTIPPPPPSSSSSSSTTTSSTTSQPSDTSNNDKNTNDNSDNQENFKTKILKSFNKKFK
jgi:hypothetical protein